jgi:hypothetical protein
MALTIDEVEHIARLALNWAGTKAQYRDSSKHPGLHRQAA